jgi:flagellar motor switch protein FliM
MRLENVVKVSSKEYISLLGSSSEHISAAINILGINSNPIYILIEKDFIYKAIEVSLGGQRLDETLEVKNRAFSKIEQVVIDSLIEIINSKLETSFREIDKNLSLKQSKLSYTSSDISIEGTETCFLGRYTLQVKNVVSKFDILIPYDAMLPIKTSLMKSFSNCKLFQNDIWKNHLQGFLLDNEVKLTVEIEVDQPLNAIEKMKVGDTIITNKGASEAFEVKINGIKIYDCKIGKISEKIAIELIDDCSR